MLTLLKKTRQKLLNENKFSKYLIYAFGEIVLVVIGILIAIAINNNNEEHKIRAKELNYLSGIKSDIHLNLIELKTFIKARETSVNSAENILEFFKNKKEVIPDKFNFNSLNVQIWYPFKRNENTYQELINSGNLAIISNDSIKDILINSQLGYKQISFLERHMTYDFENYIYPIYFSTTDLESDISNYTYQLSNGADGERTALSKEKIELLLKNQTFKNGFVLSIFNNKKLITEYKNMIFMTEKLINLIDSELIKNK